MNRLRGLWAPSLLVLALPALTLLTGRAAPAAAQAPAPTAMRDTAAVIDDYVTIGLRANLSLQIQTLELERSQAALAAARARFFPELALAARYSRNDGGREIDLQLDRLLNPVYSTLNDLLVAQGRPAGFGNLQSQSFSFLRPEEQDTRLTLRQALYVPAIPAAVRAQTALVDVAGAAQTAFARRLKRDIAVAYLDWQRAGNAVAIVTASRDLLGENLRVNSSLFRNGKVTQDRELRARAELLAVEQQLAEARNGVTQAQSYLNFLLNRPLATPLEASDGSASQQRTSLKLAALQEQALRQRPEVQQAAGARQAADARIDVARAARKPTLSLGVDVGTQGERYEFGRGSNFSTVSVLLNWTLFDGGLRRAEVTSARAEQRQARLQEEQLAAQIQLEVQQALDRLSTANESLATAAARTEAARAAFRIASRKRDEAVISSVEFIDARATLTAAELALANARNDVLSRQAELDYATAAGRLPSPVAPP
jgi:outer membrane protein